LDLMKNHSEHDPVKKVASPTDRRSFLRTLIGGIGIAVPAIAVLGASPASASRRVPRINPCSSVYRKLIGNDCNGQPTCPVGYGAECITTYAYISRIDGRVCSTFSDNTGPCQPRCPAGAAC
jgi:hypothetical protein